MEEIDQLVRLLGGDERDGGAHGGLDRLDELVRRAATSGLSITYSSTGSREQVAPELAEVAYRVTQEGIANALQHAPGSSIRVAVDVTDAELSVTVANAASYGSGARLATAGGCFGLAGLRERIVTLRGTLEARPTPTGGWRLGTRLPLPGLKQHA